MIFLVPPDSGRGESDVMQVRDPGAQPFLLFPSAPPKPAPMAACLFAGGGAVRSADTLPDACNAQGKDMLQETPL